MTDFTPAQGRYLAYIRAYTNLHGYPPAESEIADAIGVSAPSVSQMIKTLEKKGLIEREPGQPRTIRVQVPEDEIPPWKHPRLAESTAEPKKGQGPATVSSPADSADLYVLKVFLSGGPVSKKFAKKEISRVIEIRGDQTLEDLHAAIFKAYDRWDDHLYEFQFGKRPFDPEGPNYMPNPERGTRKCGDVAKTRIDDLDLKPERVFGYRFDFGDEWFHQIQVERIEQAIPTVTYPRVTKKVGKSPPQYSQ